MRISVFGFLLATLCIASSCQADVINLPSENWMGTYIGESKTGYTHSTVEKTVFLGKPAYHLHETELFRAVDSYNKIRSKNETDYYLDDDMVPILATYNLVSTEISLLKNETTSHTDKTIIRYSTGKAECKMVRDGKVSYKTIPLPSNYNMSHLAYTWGLKKPCVGEKVKWLGIVPADGSIDESGFEVVGRERIEVGKQSYDAFKIVDDYSDITWITENGKEIKFESPRSGRAWSCETREEAMEGLECDGPNICELLELKVVPQIFDSEQVTELKLQFSDFPLDSKMIINDSYQSAVSSSQPNLTVNYHIIAKTFDSSKSVKLPVKSKDYSKYLVESTGIEVEDVEIKKLMREIIGNETNAYKAASQIRAWVHENITASEEVDPDNSAIAVSKSRYGVCRHKAILFAALARAAGIPTRLVAGLVYGDGSLNPHAWVEIFVGEWVALDPSFPSDFVDATHIKLREGSDISVYDGMTWKPGSSARIELASYILHSNMRVSPCPPNYTAIYCTNGSILCIPPGCPNPGCGPTVPAPTPNPPTGPSPTPTQPVPPMPISPCPPGFGYLPCPNGSYDCIAPGALNPGCGPPCPPK